LDKIGLYENNFGEQEVTNKEVTNFLVDLAQGKTTDRRGRISWKPTTAASPENGSFSL
jgi:hypothetical protein